jgi:hypothetical protein
MQIDCGAAFPDCQSSDKDGGNPLTESLAVTCAAQRSITPTVVPVVPHAGLAQTRRPPNVGTPSLHTRNSALAHAEAAATARSTPSVKEGRRTLHGVNLAECSPFSSWRFRETKQEALRTHGLHSPELSGMPTSARCEPCRVAVGPTPSVPQCKHSQAQLALWAHRVAAVRSACGGVVQQSGLQWRRRARACA